MKTIKIIPFIIAALIIISCQEVKEESKVEDPMELGPSKVEMKEADGKHRLYVDGEEFFVKGAGCEFGPCYLVAEHGGNSIRTWRVDDGQRTGKEVLDAAWEHDLMVMMGLDVARERHGFDYDDEEAVAEQLEKFREQVKELKDHPALLGWGIGNELNLHYTNKKVWDAVNDIARMIDEVDGNHVTTTMLAGIGKDEVEYIAENCPDLDFLSVQMYGDIVNLQQRLEEANYDGPYLVTEWGATGHWEMPDTEWGRPIEQTSTEKAEAIKERYKKAILSDEENCMGAYVFLWGQKQERTPTWYGLFTEKGEKTEAINVMEYYWTGEWPEHEAPQFKDIFIDGEGGRFDDVKLVKDKEYVAKFDVEYPEMNELNVRAEIMPEPEELSEGGDYEPRPETIENLIISANTQEVRFKAPGEKGEYRIYVYVLNEHGYAGTGNVPFLIQ